MGLGGLVQRSATLAIRASMTSMVAQQTVVVGSIGAVDAPAPWERRARSVVAASRWTSAAG
jgi:hypothetical protein